LPRSLTSPILTARWPGVAPNIFRLHTDEARILYEVDNGASTVYIINIGRV